MSITLKGRLNHLENNKNIKDTDKKTLFEAYEKMRAEGKRDTTLNTYIKCWERFCAWSPKTITEIDKDKDEKLLIKYINYLTDNKLKKGSIDHYKSGLFVLFFHLHSEIRTKGQKEEAWFYPILKSTRNKDFIDPETVPTADHIKTLLKYADCARDKALIITAFDTGARAKELMSCKMKHLGLTSNGSYIHLPVSKTEKRTVALVYAKEYLEEYLNTHPRASDPEAPLWLSKHRGFYSQPLTYEGYGAILKEIRTRAVQNGELPSHVRITPHYLRHASVTQTLRLGANFETMRKVYGWSNYDMILRYSHLVPEETLKSIRELKGEEPQEEYKVVFEKKKCFKCGTVYPETTHFCLKCHRPLDKSAAEDMRVMEELIIDKILPVYMKGGSQAVAEKWKDKRYKERLQEIYETCTSTQSKKP